MTSASTAGFLGQLAAKLGPNLVHALAEHVAVRSREIHVLEDALRLRRGCERPYRLQALLADDDDLTRFDVAKVGRANQVHGARLGADHPRVAKPADRQRPEPMRIARADQPILRHHHEGIGAAHLRTARR